MSGIEDVYRPSIMRLIFFVCLLQLAASALHAQVLPFGPHAAQRSGMDLLDEPWKSRPLNDFLLAAPPPPAYSALSSPWSYGSLGLFCKIDVKLARHLPVPLFMRLGDVRQEIDWEHGNGPGWKP